MENPAPDAELIAHARAAAGEGPICSDLDGTVVKSNLLMETLICLLRERPFAALRIPLWFLRGRAALKRELASCAPLDVALLPYDDRLLALLRAEQARGRRVVLATAADQLIADRVGDHLGFDEVIASDGRDNLAGEKKARELLRRYGDLGYEFVGEDRMDLPCWHHARAAVIVGGNEKVRKRVQELGIPHREVPRDSHRVAAFVKAFGLGRWVMYLAVLALLLIAQRLYGSEALAALPPAFVSFCLISSGLTATFHLANLERDRRDAARRSGPFASGALPLAIGLAVAPILLAAGVLLAVYAGSLA
jgi:phosphoserine phosphatase